MTCVVVYVYVCLCACACVHACVRPCVCMCTSMHMHSFSSTFIQKSVYHTYKSIHALAYMRGSPYNCVCLPVTRQVPRDDQSYIFYILLFTSRIPPPSRQVYLSSQTINLWSPLGRRHTKCCPKKSLSGFMYDKKIVLLLNILIINYIYFKNNCFLKFPLSFHHHKLFFNLLFQ